MAITEVAGAATGLAEELAANIGRYARKRPDWDAFPANRGFEELERAQIRYIGAGGSPKVSDPETLKAEHFTLSIVHMPVGKYAASHAHEVEEAFLILQGVLTVAWDYDGEIVEARLGPGDMILNEPIRPHGFRNDGLQPVQMAIMVANIKGAPVAIKYKYHPKDVGADLARAFGARPEKTSTIGASPASANHGAMERWIKRFSQDRAQWHAAGFARMPYIGEGGAPSVRYRKDFMHLPCGRGVQPYRRSVEDVYFVTGGCLTVGWQEDGKVVEQRLGPKDAVFNPPGRAHYFRNDGLEDAQFMMIVGEPGPENVRFQAVQA
jgi:mannose-6-phosphate isomerase-like protein (cupin superfamily)